MAIVRIGLWEYDTEDIVGRCPICKKDLFDAPDAATLLDLTDEEMKKIESGDWMVVHCPYCGFADLWMLS